MQPRLWPFATALALLWLVLRSVGAVPALLWIVAVPSLILILASLVQEAALLMVEYPRCPVCGEAKSERLWAKDKLLMVRCAGCGQVMASPRYRPTVRSLLVQFWSWKDTHDPARISQAEGEDNARENILPKLKLLAEHGYNGDGLTLIDIGCATGAFLQAARGAGFDVCGIEPGWFSSRYARVQSDLDVQTVSLERFCSSVRFDVVVSLHVIEHLPDPLTAMKMMFSLCREGGVLLIATPNLGCERAGELGVRWGAVGPADHLFLFDRTTLGNLVQHAGLKVAGVSETGHQGDELVVLAVREA